MTEVFHTSFSKGDYSGELNIKWDDAAFADGSISFEITATARNAKDLGWGGGLSSSVSVELNEQQEPILKLSLLNDESSTITISLKPLLEHSTVLERIPAPFFGGHPLVGCLIRSGLSAVIGQILECKGETAGTGWDWSRMSAIGRCIRDHIPDLAARAAFRSVRCIARFGFG